MLTTGRTRRARRARERRLSESFEQAVVTASESERRSSTTPIRSIRIISYYDEHDHVHQVWMLDGVTAYNELRAAERAGVRGTALWRLGTEDPSLWSIWDATHPDDATRARLAEMPPGYDLILEGEGDIWRITATPQKGQRTFRFDAASNASLTKATSACRFPTASTNWAARQRRSPSASTTARIRGTRRRFWTS